jgi:EAL domain-containing protein (putative c-di-GMP-specific phosphodiesterase class I)/GGDEF domain-containing protein
MPTPRRDPVEQALARRFAAAMRRGSVLTPLGIGAVLVLLWPFVDRGPLLVWGAIGLVETARMVAAGRFERSRADQPDVDRWWVVRLSVSSLVHGCMWGGAAVVAAHWGHGEATMFATIAMLGVLTTFVLTPSAPAPAFGAACLGLFVPTAISLGIEGDAARRLAVVVAVFAGVACVAYRVLHRLVVASERAVIGETRRADSLAIQLADRDPTTGLRNRTSFVAELEREALAARAPAFVTITLANIRRMSAINELHGVSIGNHAIESLAARLGTLDGEGVVVARLAGDEFAVGSVRGLGEAPPELAQTIAIDAGSPDRSKIDVSIRLVNVAATIQDVAAGQVTVNDLLADAAAQLRSEHRAERMRPGAGIGSLAERRELTLDLRSGIKAAGVAAWFQPIVDRTTKVIVGWEALARWRRGDTVILPDRFIPLVELGGFHGRLFDAMVADAVGFLQQIDALGCSHHTMHINLTPTDLGRTNLVPGLRDALAAGGIDPTRLVVEITEEHVLELNDHMRKALDDLATIGVHLAVDDFGTGYSSLAHLLDLPTDHIKIDRRFVRGTEEDGDARTLVRGLIGLANGLGIFTVAEGVETAEQAEALARLGVDQLQGFLIAPALPPDEAVAFVRTHRSSFPPPSVPAV